MLRVPRRTPEHPEQLKVDGREGPDYGAFSLLALGSLRPEHRGTGFQQKTLEALHHKASRGVPVNAHGGTNLEQQMKSCSGVFQRVPVLGDGVMPVIYLFFIDIFLIDIHVPDIPPGQWQHTHSLRNRGMPPYAGFNAQHVHQDLLPFRNSQQLSERFSMTDRTLRVSMKV